jgi:crossover junction endodeoxyribonuclease RusA
MNIILPPKKSFDLRREKSGKPSKGTSPAKPKAPPRSDSLPVTEETFRVRLPWPPSINHYYRRCRGMIFISEEGMQFRADVLDAWQRQTGDVTFGHWRLLALRLTAVFPDDIERDLDNLLKATLDALQHAGAYRNDAKIKLLIVEQGRVEKPGWLDLTIGLKPGSNQQNLLFKTDFDF